MSRRAPMPPFRRATVSILIASTAAVVLSACSSSEPPNTPSSAEEEGPRVGIILGGGGEVGIAWQTGVLAALADGAGLTPDAVDTVVGTSAGSVAGTYYSLGSDLDVLVEQERAGQMASAPVAGGDGDSPIPPEMMAALSSTDGTIEERGQRIGELAMKANTGVASQDYVGYITSILPTPEWPELDLRITSVSAETGKTVLWDADDGVPLGSAIASSTAVPGFLPTVEINGEQYTDAPRTSFSRQLVEEKDLDAIIYIGMPTPNLSNTVEEETLDELEDEGVNVIRITGSVKANEVAADALNPDVRPAAVELGLEDGQAVVSAVTRLLR